MAVLCNLLVFCKPKKEFSQEISAGQYGVLPWSSSHRSSCVSEFGSFVFYDKIRYPVFPVVQRLLSGVCRLEAGGRYLLCGMGADYERIAYELCCIFIATVDISGAVSIIVCKTAVYLVIYGLAGLTFARFMPEKGSYHIGPRQLLSALFLWIVYELLFELLRAEEGLSAFSLQTWNILLIQGYCITILYLQNTMFKKSTMKQELDTLN